MILAFKSEGTPFLVGVGKRRELSIAAPKTQYVFKLVSALGELRAMTKAEGGLVGDLEAMVKSFKSLKMVREYVISEMSKLGMVFIREMSVSEYEVLVGK